MTGKAKYKDIQQWLSRYSVEYHKSLILEERLSSMEINAPKSVAIQKIKNELTAAKAQMIIFYDEIDAAIGKISGAGEETMRGVLQMRYLDSASWNEINFALFGDRKDFPERVENYLRTTFNYQERAMKKLSSILETQEPAESRHDSST